MRRALALPLAILALVITSPAPTMAETFTGNDLHKYCREGGDRPVCVAFVAGMFAMDNPNEALHCAPDSPTFGQIADVVALYLREHPEKRHLGVVSIYMVAMAEAFPCPGFARQP